VSKLKTSLNILKKLAEEGKAISPVVKEASQSGGSLMKEGQLAQGQKLIQKTDPENSFIHNYFKKTAGLAGAVGASSLISQEEANAAGVQTIAKALGVTEDVAREIKIMAANVPPDVFEQNIQAIQKVSQYKKDPKSMQELGRGIDAVAYDAGDQVVKTPRMGKLGKAWNSERMDIIPSIVEDAGYGPKTKTIKTSENKYQVQEKLSPLGEVGSTHPKFLNDTDLNLLKDRELELMFNNKGQRRSLSDKEQQELFDVRKKYSDRESQIFQELNIPEEVLDNRLDINAVDSDKLEEYMKRRLNQKGVGSVVEPRDIHTDNVGLDKQNQMKILDTGNFMQLDKQKMTPAMRKKAIENYIALPEEKARFEQSLYQSSKASPTPLERLKAKTDIKKAAAIAPMAMNPNEEFINKPINTIKDIYTSVRKPVLDTTRKIGESIADAVRIPMPMSEEAKQQERDIAGGVAEMALDPSNFVAPGAGLIFGAADVGLYNEPTPEELEQIRRQQAIDRMR
jgi:hypothetical protein